MIFTVEQAPRILCPSRSATKPTPCCGPKCAAWAWVSNAGEYGACGLSRDPLEGALRDPAGTLFTVDRGEVLPFADYKARLARDVAAARAESAAAAAEAAP